MTVAADTVALNISYEARGFFFDRLIDNNEKVVSSKKHTQIKTSPKTITYLIGKNWLKTLPFGAAHICIAHLGEYPFPRG